MLRNLEKTFIGKRYNFRIGWHQVALFRNRDHRALIDWLTPWSDRLYSMRKGLYIGHRPIFTYGMDSADIAGKRAE